MEPTLEEYSIIIFDKISYKFTNPKKDDLVAFKAEGPLLTYSNGKYFVKRVIGVPGDHIVIEDNQVFINGNLIYEPYLRATCNTTGDIDIVVPNDHLFVMGDNRNNSSDSRDSRIGLVSYSSIIGKIAFK